jgi:hypothetical protein
MSKPCYVYIVGHEHATFGYAVKVGITEALGGRMASLQTGSCEDLTLFYAARMPERQMAARAESLFHEIFDDRRIRGEWFGFPPGQAMFNLGNIVSRLAQETAALDPSDIGIAAAFEPFHEADYDTRAEWVNDWTTREEERAGA